VAGTTRRGGGRTGGLRGRRSGGAQPDLGDSSLYLNRELSLLEFQRRVLEQAKNPATPLLERLRFLTICSTNLDEFFEIRVAGLKHQVAFGVARVEPDGLSAAEVLERVGAVVRDLVGEQYRFLNQDLLPALEAEGIRLVRRAQWGAPQQRWIRRYFSSEVMPVLTPMGLDPAHPFPRLLNKGLNFIVSVRGPDAFGRQDGIAVLQVPRSLPRVMVLPPRIADGPYDFVMLSSVVHEYVRDLFPGMEVLGCYPFRVTRNSDLWVDEEEIENLLQAVQGELPGRRYGAAVRLEVAEETPSDVRTFLLERVNLQPADLYAVEGPVNLHRLVAIYEGVGRASLKYPPFVPGIPRRLRVAGNVFEAIRAGDVLLHHPYQSFAPVLDLVREAAADPAVLAVKMTLYRTGLESPLVPLLVEAARAGKEVTALVELRARFDEAANIDLATRLQEAGANVVYGIVGYKAHAKALLVVRREGRRLRRYVHLGTGNYHSRTARAYTDLSLLTCDRETGEDVHRLFGQLTGLGRASRMRLLVQSPFTLHTRVLALVAAEAEEALAGRPARIFAKMNALTDPATIRALYEASRAGVEIDLVVRGACSLRPGIPGVSERIRVRSIVDRFLEHSRVFRFHARGLEVTYAASADWMERNLFHRVEIAFPIVDPALRARIQAEVVEPCLADDTAASVLLPDGTYRRARRGRGRRRNAQGEVLARLADRDGSEGDPPRAEALAVRKRSTGRPPEAPRAPPRGRRA
jgi:polyphosphate kinase